MNAKKEIKKRQKRINRIVREMNKNIINDDLWRGRFEVRQIDRVTGVWEDMSGVWIVPIFLFVDKKTGFKREKYSRYHTERFFASDMWRMMNDFIVEDVKVWNEGRDVLYKDTTNYAKIKIDYDKERENL